MHRIKRGFSLIELMIAVIIVGILVSFAVPTFINSQERARNQEAFVGLRLIRAAQNVLRSETGQFYGPDGDFAPGGTANVALRLDLNETNWDFDIAAVNNGAVPPTFSADAYRVSGPFSACIYTITQADDVVTDNGSCLP